MRYFLKQTTLTRRRKERGAVLSQRERKGLAACVVAFALEREQRHEVGAGHDDGREGSTLCAFALPHVLHQPTDFPIVHAGPSGAHGLDHADAGDASGFPQCRDLVLILHRAHSCDERVDVTRFDTRCERYDVARELGFVGERRGQAGRRVQGCACRYVQRATCDQ